MEELALPGGLVRDAPVRIFGGAPRPIVITILRKHERQAARPPSSFLSPLVPLAFREAREGEQLVAGLVQVIGDGLAL
jgi:hypothetical protein